MIKDLKDNKKFLFYSLIFLSLCLIVSVAFSFIVSLKYIKYEKQIEELNEQINQQKNTINFAINSNDTKSLNCEYVEKAISELSDADIISINGLTMDKSVTVDKKLNKISEASSYDGVQVILDVKNINNSLRDVINLHLYLQDISANFDSDSIVLNIYLKEAK